MTAAMKKNDPKLDPTKIPMDPGLELWKNAVAGMVAIKKLGEYGRERTELVKGGRQFTITPQERRMNQNICARPELDFFTNGTLQPLFLIDDEPDTPSLRNNPNILEDKDIEGVFKSKGEAFAERLDNITNLATLERLAELAREPRLNATIQQYELIKARQRALDEGPVLETGPAGLAAVAATAERKPRAVTPK